MHLPRELIASKITIKDIVDNNSIPVQQKMYILEASTEFLEYSFSKNDMDKEHYLEQFHNITKERAALGQGERLNIKSPANPIKSHRAVKATVGFGYREDKSIGFLGIRPAYHDLEDSNYGFLRGTQIEFMNIMLSYAENDIELEKATIISIASIAQRSEFFDSFSWRTKFGWDKNYIDNESNFIATLGAGFSWGNKLGYTYIMVDPLLYINENFISGIGGSLGFVIDKSKYMSTNIELTRRIYDNAQKQSLAKITQSFRLSQNLQLKFKYDYKERFILNKDGDEQTYRAVLNYYF